MTDKKIGEKVPLTDEAIETLHKNPYVKKVSVMSVSFTDDFKILAYRQKKIGIPLFVTLKQCGINPDYLGPGRIKGLYYNVNKYAKRHNILCDCKIESAEEKIMRLEKQVETLTQVIIKLEAMKQ